MSCHSPIRYQQVPVRHLQHLPIRTNPRLEKVRYWRTNAPGMTGGEGRPRTHGHGTVVLAGEFLVAICLVRRNGQWILEIASQPFDIETRRHAPLRFSDQMLADMFRAVQQKDLAQQSRADGGRN